MVEWADLIVVMERRHGRALTRKFGKHLSAKRVVSLDIADDYEFMDKDLVALITERVGRLVK